MTTLILLFLLTSAFVGYLGRNSRLGFWGVLLLSVVFTPLVVFIILALLGQISGPGPASNVQDAE